MPRSRHNTEFTTHVGAYLAWMPASTPFCHQEFFFVIWIANLFIMRSIIAASILPLAFEGFLLRSNLPQVHSLPYIILDGSNIQKYIQ